MPTNNRNVAISGVKSKKLFLRGKVIIVRPAVCPGQRPELKPVFSCRRVVVMRREWVRRSHHLAVVDEACSRSNFIPHAAAPIDPHHLTRESNNVKGSASMGWWGSGGRCRWRRAGGGGRCRWRGAGGGELSRGRRHTGEERRFLRWGEARSFCRGEREVVERRWPVTPTWLWRRMDG